MESKKYVLASDLPSEIINEKFVMPSLTSDEDIGIKTKEDFIVPIAIMVTGNEVRLDRFLFLGHNISSSVLFDKACINPTALDNLAKNGFRLPSYESNLTYDGAADFSYAVDKRLLGHLSMLIGLSKQVKDFEDSDVIGKTILRKKYEDMTVKEARKAAEADLAKESETFYVVFAEPIITSNPSLVGKLIISNANDLNDERRWPSSCIKITDSGNLMSDMFYKHCHQSDRKKEIASDVVIDIIFNKAKARPMLKAMDLDDQKIFKDAIDEAMQKFDTMKIK